MWSFKSNANQTGTVKELSSQMAHKLWPTKRSVTGLWRVALPHVKPDAERGASLEMGDGQRPVKVRKACGRARSRSLEETTNQFGTNCVDSTDV